MVKPMNITGKDLSRLRIRLGYTQKQFAKEFKVGRTTILNWERTGLPPYGPVRTYAKLTFFRLTRKANNADAT